MGRGEGTEPGLKPVLKLGHVPLFKCSEAVLEGFEAEKTESQREHLSFTDLGKPVSGFRMRMGSRWVQYQAPFPLMALVRTVMRASKRLVSALAAMSSGEGRGSVELVELVEAIVVVVVVVVSAKRVSELVPKMGSWGSLR